VTAPTVQVGAATPDTLAELHRDLAEHDQIAGRRSTKAEKRIARLERDLTDPRRRAATYRLVATQSTLPHAVARLLCALTLEFGARLENCFPGRKRMRQRLGAWAQRYSTNQLTKWVSVAVKLGWAERVPLTQAEDGELLDAGASGRFISATGIAFHVPAGVIAPGHPGVPGPRVWSRRIYGKRGTA
jgi:hypothetical protein